MTSAYLSLILPVTAVVDPAARRQGTIAGALNEKAWHRWAPAKLACRNVARFGAGIYGRLVDPAASVGARRGRQVPCPGGHGEQGSRSAPTSIPPFLLFFF